MSYWETSVLTGGSSFLGSLWEFGLRFDSRVKSKQGFHSFYEPLFKKENFKVKVSMGSLCF